MNVLAGDTVRVALEVFSRNGQPLELSSDVTWRSGDPVVAEVLGSADQAFVAGLSEGTTTVEVTVLGETAAADVAVFGAGFDIEVRHTGGGPDAAQRSFFDRAAAHWMSIIVADLPDVPVSMPAGQCGGVRAPAIDEVVDDVLIFTEIRAIDGSGGAVAAAGRCLIRESSGLTVAGGMVFDEADLFDLQVDGGLESVIRHEIGHVLGIGTRWHDPGVDLVVDPSVPDQGGEAGADTHFIGPLGRAGFDRVGGTGYDGAKVPVENSPGQLNIHWRESVLGTELMTPVGVSGTREQTSLVSVESLADLGYTVNPGAADFYVWTAPLSAAQDLRGTSIRLVDDVVWGPLYTIDTRGRIVSRP